MENFKKNGEWIDHIETKYDELDGVLNNTGSNSSHTYTNTIINYSVLGSFFELEFAFQDGIIDVYKIYDGGHNRITTYMTEIDISEIKALQVWGDVQKIKELTFCYA